MSDNKKLKSRRSSILKPPKPRNPLSDVDLNPPTETTFMKSRRVSFANVHFKKEFTADPEKNTIWHNSYEEEMNKSDKSDLTDLRPVCNDEPNDINMSVDMSLDSDIMNCTQMLHLDNSLETALANNSDSSISSAVIDLTKHHNNKAQMLVNIQNQPHFDEIHQVFHSTESISIEDEHCKRRTIHFQNENIEFTDTVPTNVNIQLKQVNRQTINFKTHPQNSGMDMTQLINFNNESEGVTMEITKSIPSHIRNQNKNLQGQTRQTINFKTDPEIDSNMDFTQAIAIQENQKNRFRETENDELELAEYIPSNVVLNKHRQTINFKHSEDRADMDMTHAADKKTETDTKPVSKYIQKRQTIHFKTENEGSMDLTQDINKDNHHFGPIIQQNIHKSTQKRQTINFNQTSNDANMEMTEIIPTKLLIAAQVVEDADKENKFVPIVRKNQPSKQRQTINFNQSSNDANMETTKVIPTEMILAMACQKALPIEDKENIPLTSRRKTVLHSQENEQKMEITQNIPAIIKHSEHKSRQTILFNQTEAAHMDLTENIIEQDAHTAENVLSNFYRKKDTTKDGKVHRQTRQTIHFNTPDTGNMEITENIPVYLAQNADNRQITENIPINYTQKEKQSRRTIHFNNSSIGNMEITENIPINFVQTITKEKQGRQTMYFNNPDMGNMEITQNIPISTITKEKQGRQTMHFNNPEMGNMEITQNIPIITITKEKQDRQTMHLNSPHMRNMEITENIPINVVQTITKEKQGRQTMHFNSSDMENMEITENIPINFLQTRAKEKQSRQTMHFNNPDMGNMDITENIPTNFVQTMKTDKQNRQTIHFNNPNTGNTEITGNISAHLAQNVELIGKASRQTIHFNQSGNLDITESIIPSNLVQNSTETEECSTQTEDFETNFKNNTENEKLNYFNIENTEKTENIQKLLIEEVIHFDTIGNAQKMPERESVSFQFVQNSTNLNPSETVTTSINFALNIEKSMNIQDTFNLTKHIESAQNTKIEELETSKSKEESETNPPSVDASSSKNKIFRFIGQPLILDPNSEEELNSSDICQRIKFAGQTDDFSVSKINITDKLDLTPIQNSLNLTDNLNSVVDSTEKLINCKIALPSSEYSKIILEEIDKNYSIVNTSFPEHLEISSTTETSEDGRNMSINRSCLDESQNKVESIISVNSSIESFEKIDDLEQLCSKIIMPLRIDYSEENKIPELPNYESCEEIMLQRMENEPMNLKDKLKALLNINHKENTTFTVPKYNVEDDNKPPTKMFQRLFELNLKLKKVDKTNDKPLTLLDKIKQMQNNNTLWNLIPNSEYSFTYMNDTIKFNVQLEPNSEIVKKVDFLTQIDESQYKPIGRYNYQIQKVKLTEEKIKSAVGDRFTIFSLLDYVSKVGDESMDILKEFEYLLLNIGMKLDENLNATLLYTNTVLRLAFEVTFNLNDLNNINQNMISIKNLVSNIDENALKRSIKDCPPGIAFIRVYHQKVQNYLKVMQKYKHKK